jgi:hypothetical protein
MLAIKIKKHNIKTYLSSQSSHGGIVISRSCCQSIPVYGYLSITCGICCHTAPPWLCNSGHPLHHCVAPAHGTTTSVMALMAPRAPKETLGATEAPSLETRPPKWTQKQSHWILIVDTGSLIPSFRWEEVDPRKKGVN